MSKERIEIETRRYWRFAWEHAAAERRLGLYHSMAVECREDLEVLAMWAICPKVRDACLKITERPDIVAARDAG